MRILRIFGEYLYFAAIIGIGMVHLVTSAFPTGLEPTRPHFQGSVVLAWGCGIILIASALGALLSRFRTKAISCLAAMLFLLFIYPNLVKSLGDMHNASQWTATGEMLSLWSGALIYRSFFSDGIVARNAQYALAVALLVFGLLHILYYDYIQTLIPVWIPFPKFWGWAVMVIFFATGLSIIFNMGSRVMGALFGLMFLCWVVLLHGPRVAASPRLEPEWTSLFVAMAMSGIGFMLAGKASENQDESKRKFLSFYRRDPNN